jgi:hypothetical protein
MAITNIIVKKPVSDLPDVLNTIFDRSLAISEAVSRFWNMKLAKSAEIGEVKEYNGYYVVSIIHK